MIEKQVMDVDDRLVNIPLKATEWVKRHGDRRGQHLVRQLGRSNVAGVPMKRKMNGIGQQQKSYSETKLPRCDNTTGLTMFQGDWVNILERKEWFLRNSELLE